MVRVSAGAPAPLGVWPVGDGVNVAVWSQAAAAVDLCLFDAEDRERRVRLPERTGAVFHGHIAGVGEGARYGLRVYGPFDPASGARFDPSKLLVDPYAVALDVPFALHPSQFSHDAPGQDSAPYMPKAVVSAEAAPAAPRLCVPWDRTVIYEAHVKGLTQRHPQVPEAQRGRFAGLAHPAVIEHLQTLGVTTLELLPTAAWIDERHLARLGLSNYWGYNSVAFAAPDPRLAPNGWAEISAATGALAAAGIETVLDVVFNHTGEGDERGPTLCLRGLDNAGYYRLRPDRPDLYVDDTGTGNTLALDRPQGVALAMHALRTWARRGGVAGFRFDLATVLGRRADGFDAAAPLLAAIDQDPELCRLKRIAEPWDCGPGGYQLGRFAGDWGEWNDQYRNRVRSFWGGAGAVGPLAEVLAGSQPMLQAHARPSRGINFVTAHDGFTLADLVAFETKRNHANGEDNRDGEAFNRSWNHGVEGPSEDPQVQRRRLNDQRALLATLMLSRGTPMLSMGAELGHSQAGNNNAYAQDNAISWLDWAGADLDLARFVGRLAQARAACPALRADRFLTGEVQAHGFADVTWRRPGGEAMTPADWEDSGGAGLVCLLAAGEDHALSRAVIVLHRGEALLRVVLPEPRDGHAWHVAVDSADVARGGLAADAAVEAAPRSVLLLIEQAGLRPARAPDDAAVSALAERAGVSPEWWTLAGERHAVSVETQRALLAAMGLATATRDDLREAQQRLAAAQRRTLPFALIARPGEPVPIRTFAPDGWMTLEREDGQVEPLRIAGGQAVVPPLPMGRHRLRADDVEAALIVAPVAAQAVTGDRRRGVSAQLYSLRGASDAGMGDFATLVELARGVAARGLDTVALNPLHMLFPGDRTRVSPYYPSDRRFLDPVYIDAGTGACAGPAREHGADLIDFAAVWARKSAALEQAFDRFEAGPSDPAFDAFGRAGGAALHYFALFQAIAETRPGQAWPGWPSGLHSPGDAEAQAFARSHARRLRFHQYLQWRADAQLAQAAGAGVGLLRDLAVGPAPDGAEVWAAPDGFAHGVSIGAPPDAFAPQGQVWGLPPPRPQAWAEDGYAAFTTLLRSNMRHAGAVRIDHVLGLARLFWAPEGASGRDGAYVHYPLDDLLAVVALESARANCVVVGEDLGTAAETLRPALARAGVYGYRVLPFERDGRAFRAPSAYPARALACVSTHDLPPLAGWWDGADLAERRRLGLLDDGALQAAVAARDDDKAALVEALIDAGLWARGTIIEPLSDALAAAVHAYVAAAPSQIVLAQVEDLAGERTSVNVPGTHLERPNWRRRLPATLEALWGQPRARAVLGALGARQAAAAPDG